MAWQRKPHGKRKESTVERTARGVSRRQKSSEAAKHWKRGGRRFPGRQEASWRIDWRRPGDLWLIGQCAGQLPRRKGAVRLILSRCLVVASSVCFYINSPERWPVIGSFCPRPDAGNIRYFFNNRHLIVVRVDEETWELVVEGGRILRGDRLKALREPWL